MLPGSSHPLTQASARPGINRSMRSAGCGYVVLQAGSPGRPRTGSMTGHPSSTREHPMSTTDTTLRSPWSGTASAEELAHWREVAERVAGELRPGALERDRTSDPREALEVLRASGLANLVIPAENGGHAAHWETAFDVIRTVSRADASLGQILGYHYLNQACVAFYGDPAGRERWYRASVEGDLFWSDAFNPVSPDLSFVAEGDGYLLNGVKR